MLLNIRLLKWFKHECSAILTLNNSVRVARVICTILPVDNFPFNLLFLISSKRAQDKKLTSTLWKVNYGELQIYKVLGRARSGSLLGSGVS